MIIFNHPFLLYLKNYLVNNNIGDKMKKSIWEDYLTNKSFPKLEENIQTDVLVVGGGIAGILIARKLHDNNIKTILLEKNKIASGNTSKTTAFLTVQHETLFQSLGIEKAKQYLDINNQALLEYKELSKKYDFDYEEVDSCLFSKNYEIIEKEYEILNKLKQNVYIKDDIPFCKDTKGIAFKKQAIINPIKLVNSLINDLNIYEDSEVIEINSSEAILKNGIKIKFNKIIITTHYPIINKSNLLFLKLTQRKSYVVAIKHNKIDGTYCNIDQDGLYYRMYKDYLIIGGNDKDTGTKCMSDFEMKVCEKFNLSKDDLIYSWCGQDCITLDGIPYIGYCNMFSKNHIIVTGFNLWGFTWAMASSNIILKIIKENKEFSLTKPNRFWIKKKLFKNIKTSFKNLINFKTPRCSHMGCALVYNKKEHIWECPCHGSIYNSEKEVKEGPAQKDIK